MRPDQIVAKHGVDVDLTRVTVAVFTDEDEFDEGASTIQTVTVKAIVSLPSERDLRLFQGRERVPTRRMTVDSGTDISADREGRADQVSIDGRLYEVDEVRDDVHGFLGVRKKTVMLVSLPGR